MHTFSPSVAHFLLHGAAGEREPPLAEKGTPLVRVGNPHHHGRSVGHVSEAPLTFHQRSFSVLALGDIEADARQADRPAGIVEVHLTLCEQPVYGPVRPHHAELCIPDVTLFETLTQGRRQPLKVIRVDQSEPVCVRERRVVAREAMIPGTFFGNLDRVRAQITVPYSQARCTLRECKILLSIPKSLLRPIPGHLKVLDEG